ncbi:DUF2815 family protein [Loigolactobacillus zhaoyuanensis]|uniref:DUF2815 family protein n=1 Tax=Loigolactobacillus zhaoyuanensis TaxID=2486017 RepID=A0ABW8U8A9_9LACO
MTENTNTTKVITDIVRFSFVHLLEPTSFEGQEPKYSVMLLIPKTDSKTLGNIKAAQKAAAELGKSKFKNNKIPAKLKTTLRDGDEEMDTEEYPEFKGMMFINVSNKNKVGMVGTQRDEHGKLKRLAEDPEEVYSGMYGRASINFFAFNTAGNQGVSAGLNNIQKTRDGDHLGGGAAKPENDFDDWEDDTQDADMDDDLLD